MISFRKKKKFFLLLLSISIVIIYYSYFQVETYKNSFISVNSKYNSDFVFEKSLLVFLHIQKTGGSEFDRNIIKYLMAKDEITEKWRPACVEIPSSELSNTKPNENQSNKKRLKFRKYLCSRNSMEPGNLENNWYFSRQTFGWACGLHADYTRLFNCINQKYRNSSINDFKFFTILRDPIERFISEWKHVQRGATWKKSKNACNKENSLNDCLRDDLNVSEITLREFIDCKSNMAFNRQTRMLANYDELHNNCSIFEDSDMLLKSAIENLEKLSFFALNEQQYESQLLFEAMFNNIFKFSKKLKQAENVISTEIVKKLDKSLIEEIKVKNFLDIKLYNHALKLFQMRLKLFDIQNS